MLLPLIARGHGATDGHLIQISVAAASQGEGGLTVGLFGKLKANAVVLADLTMVPLRLSEDCPLTPPSSVASVVGRGLVGDGRAEWFVVAAALRRLLL